MTVSVLEEERDTETQRSGHVETNVKMEVERCHQSPKIGRGRGQEPQEASKDPSLEVSEGAQPSISDFCPPEP